MSAQSQKLRLIKEDVLDMSGNVAEWVLDDQELFAMGGSITTKPSETCVVCMDDTYTAGVRLVLD